MGRNSGVIEMSKSEPVWWALFAMGGVTAAMLAPITIFITGIGVAAGWVQEQTLFDLIHHPIGRVYLFLLIALSLFHGAHRLLFTLIDLGLKSIRGPLAILLHVAAIAGTGLAAFMLIRM